MNLGVLYSEYMTVMELAMWFRSKFNCDFSLSFMRRQTIQAKSELEIYLNSSVVFPDKKEGILKEKRAYLDLVEKTSNEFKLDVRDAAISNESTAVFTIGLQKTLDTPLLPTNIAFCKRQLWTNDLCIYNEVEKKR